MPIPEERALIETLMRAAAASPLERIGERRPTMTEPWDRRLSLALSRRTGLKPCRSPRQRLTTVRVGVPRRLVEETHWPEHLAELTDRVVAKVLQTPGLTGPEER